MIPAYVISNINPSYTQHRGSNSFIGRLFSRDKWSLPANTPVVKKEKKHKYAFRFSTSGIT